MNAIVLDGEQRSALAVTRSLGRRGIKVAVGSEKIPCLSSSSRYCDKAFSYPSPYRDPKKFIQAIRDITKDSFDSMLFPITDVTLTEILLNRQDFPERLLLPFPDYDKYVQASDKINLLKLAKELNVPTPTSFVSTDFDNFENLMETVKNSGFPVVVKASHSKIRTENGWRDTKANYAMDENELRNILSFDIFKIVPFLIQKRVEGPGIGIFLLMKNGEVLSNFAHRRIREKPPSGGVSVLCESIDPPKDVFHAAVKILKKLDWTGVAMVEFKLDREENVAKLLEVNARFWGSLQLAISSGVDFPYLLYRMARGEKIEEKDGYRIGLKSRWELGDLDHLFVRLFKNPSKLNLLPDHPPKNLLLKEFLFDFFRSSVKNEILQSTDTKPFFHEMKNYLQYFLH